MSHGCSGLATGCALCMALGLFAGRTAHAAVVLEVQAGACDREAAPVEVDLPAAMSSAAPLELIRLDTRQPVPVQVVAGTPPRLVWMIDERLEAGQSRRYRLATAARATGAIENSVTAVQADGRVLLQVGPLSVLQYCASVMPSADPEQPYFARSGFIHPVFDPQKRMLTDPMPPDHLHQHGVMFAWVKTTFEGRPVDFWNSKKQEGAIRHVALENVVSGPVLAGFTARLEHIDRTAPGGPKPALNETWDVRVYRRSEGFLFDLRSVQSCAGARLTLNKNLYGGLCVRGNSAWLERDQGDFLTSEGKTRADGNHTRPNWVDLWGKLDGKPSGMVSFCHPENFRAPQPVRLHPTKPYLCWSPCVLDDFAIEPGKPYTSRYRFFVYAGRLDIATARRLWNDYAQPVKVVVVADPSASR